MKVDTRLAFSLFTIVGLFLLLSITPLHAEENTPTVAPFPLLTALKKHNSRRLGQRQLGGGPVEISRDESNKRDIDRQ